METYQQYILMETDLKRKKEKCKINMIFGAP